MGPVILSLGSNIAPKRHFMEEMVHEVEKALKLPVLRSRMMETEPVETPEKQEWFLNCVMAGGFDGTPRQLLALCAAIESNLGRVRTSIKGPRTADVDILAFGDYIIQGPDLVLPHPGFLRRRFCLEGAREILPDFIIPGIGVSLTRYYETAIKSLAEQAVIFCD